MFWALVARRERNALPGQIDLQDAHLEPIAYMGYLGWIANEPFRQFRHVHQAVLVHPNVNEGTKSCHVGHDALQNHPRLEIFNAANVVSEARRFKGRTRVAAGLLQFRQNVVDGKCSDVTRK